MAGLGLRGLKVLNLTFLKEEKLDVLKYVFWKYSNSALSVWCCIYKDAIFCTQPVADLGEGPRGPGPPFWWNVCKRSIRK